MDRFVFPVRHGVSVLASGRLQIFGLRHWSSFLLDLVFLHKTGGGEDLLRYCQETAAHKNEVYLLPTVLDEQVATLHFPSFGAVRTGSAGFIVPEFPGQKIRAESSSNGSELRSAGFTPHKIRAELSSNGSSRPASDKNSELRAHQMAPNGVIPQFRSPCALVLPSSSVRQMRTRCGRVTLTSAGYDCVINATVREGRV